MWRRVVWRIETKDSENLLLRSSEGVTLNMASLCWWRELVRVYQTTRQHSQDDSNLNANRHQNFKYHTVKGKGKIAPVRAVKAYRSMGE